MLCTEVGRTTFGGLARYQLGLGGRETTASGTERTSCWRVVQPCLVGLMDGSVSTLAPLFATALVTRDPEDHVSGRAGGRGGG